MNVSHFLFTFDLPLSPQKPEKKERKGERGGKPDRGRGEREKRGEEKWGAGELLLLLSPYLLSLSLLPFSPSVFRRRNLMASSLPRRASSRSNFLASLAAFSLILMLSKSKCICIWTPMSWFWCKSAEWTDAGRGIGAKQTRRKRNRYQPRRRDFAQDSKIESGDVE